VVSSRLVIRRISVSDQLSLSREGKNLRLRTSTHQACAGVAESRKCHRQRQRRYVCRQDAVESRRQTVREIHMKLFKRKKKRARVIWLALDPTQGPENARRSPSVSAASSTPPLYLMPSTLVPVTIGCLRTVFSLQSKESPGQKDTLSSLDSIGKAVVRWCA
jgi:hypothetical protein